jgi:hypothetical protein
LCEQEGLLLTDAHVVLKGFRLPYMMAMGSEILVILSGLLMFGITGSRLILILAFFGPFVAVLGLRVWAQWCKNDFELLEHPSLRPILSVKKVPHCVVLFVYDSLLQLKTVCST